MNQDEQLIIHLSEKLVEALRSLEYFREQVNTEAEARYSMAREHQAAMRDLEMQNRQLGDALEESGTVNDQLRKELEEARSDYACLREDMDESLWVDTELMTKSNRVHTYRARVDELRKQ
jgi:hypothetical protein